jgi:hypothetical protein
MYKEIWDRNRLQSNGNNCSANGRKMMGNEWVRKMASKRFSKLIYEQMSE